MKYPFRFRTIKIDETHKALTIDLPQELSMISEFLFCDIQNDTHGRYYLEKIDQVLYGTESSQLIEGNVYELIIKRDITVLTNVLLENEPQNSCKIETMELKELILLWLNEKKRRHSS